MKRFVVDWVGNYLFFVPLVLVTNAWPAHWSTSVIETYLLSSLLIAAVSGRLFTLFLKHVWYRAFGEKF